MIQYVHDHYHRPMSLGEVAVHLKLSPNHLSMLFSSAMGVTFHRYVEELRLSKAEALLCDSTAQIREIAGAVGYANPKHFHRVFKAREGLSPSALRRMLV